MLEYRITSARDAKLFDCFPQDTQRFTDEVPVVVDVDEGEGERGEKIGRGGLRLNVRELPFDSLLEGNRYYRFWNRPKGYLGSNRDNYSFLSSFYGSNDITDTFIRQDFRKQTIANFFFLWRSVEIDIQTKRN